MKKRISMLLCALLCVFTLAGCGSKEEAADYSEMEATVSNMLTLCDGANQEYVDSLNEIREVELEHALVEAGLPCTAATYKDILQSWIKAQDEMGSLQSLGTFEFSEENGQINATTVAQYEERGAEMTFTFEEDGTVTGLSIGAYYSTGEILKKAAMNTLIGMGSVFGVLIFIAIIIAVMGKTMLSIESKKKAAAEAAKVVEAPAAAAPAAETSAADDLELIAVISAAIAASTGASTDSFVVRSIKRRSKTGWNRA